MSGEEKAILCVFFPAFRLQHLLRSEPALVEEAVVLFRVHQGGSTVVEVSKKAKKEGVREGMSLVQARQRCPTLHEFALDEERDTGGIKGVAEAFYALSPFVSLDPPDAIYCDMTGAFRVFAGVSGVRKCLATLLEEQGMNARASLSSSPASAWAIAAYGGEDWKEVAGVEVAEVLSQLPVAAMRLPEDVCQSLKKLGVKRIAQIRGCPKATLVRRYGKAGEDLYERARGQEKFLLQPYRPDAPLYASVELPVACHSLEPLLFSMKSLLDSLQSRMRGRGVAALRLKWELHTEVRVESGELVLPRPQHSSSVLLSILRERLSSLSLPAPVERIAVSVTEVTQGGEENPDLFARKVSSSESLDELLARLSASLGEGSVFSPRVAWTHRPESGVREVVFGLPEKKKRGRSGTNECEDDPRERPLILFPSPEAVRWVQGPTGLALKRRGGDLYAVRTISGAERLIGEWWADGFARDYHNVVLMQGDKWWTFRELNTDAWFLHGVFA